MYGKGADSIIGSTTVTGAGVAMLPATGGNMIATILAYTAIGIGVAALASQLIVRIARKRQAQATSRN
jgi:hypothetical protein